jgi:hypothetical protein
MSRDFDNHYDDCANYAKNFYPGDTYLPPVGSKITIEGLDHPKVVGVVIGQPTEKYDPESGLITVTIPYRNQPRPSSRDFFISGSPSIITIPRTDAAARSRLPAAPGVQLYYYGLRHCWQKPIDQAYIQALAFARSLGL